MRLPLLGAPCIVSLAAPPYASGEDVTKNRRLQLPSFTSGRVTEQISDFSSRSGSMSPHVKSLYDIIRVAVPQPGTCEDPNKSSCVHSPFLKSKIKECVCSSQYLSYACSSVINADQSRSEDE